MRRKILIAATAVALSMTTLLFSGCDAFLTALFDDLVQRPTNVEAGDGEYSDRIEVTWDEVNTEDEDYSVDYYEIERRVWNTSSWSEPLPISNISNNYYEDSSIQSGVPYQYQVRAVFDNDEPPSILSDSAEGYAMKATSLKLSSIPGNEEVDAATDSWVEFLAQKGMTYTITTDPAVEVNAYVLGNIREAVHTHSGSSTSTFTANKSEIHHIKVGGATAISVSY